MNNWPFKLEYFKSCTECSMCRRNEVMYNRGIYVWEHAWSFHPCREEYLYLLPLRFIILLMWRMWICHMWADALKGQKWVLDFLLWSYRWLWATGLEFLEPDLGPLEEQQSLFKPESPPHAPTAFVHSKSCVLEYFSYLILYFLFSYRYLWF